jgi:hypothetical protein
VDRLRPEFELPKPAKTASSALVVQASCVSAYRKKRALIGAPPQANVGNWMSKILPVIMCGGSGTRVWPESRESLPKQFIPLVGDRSTFQSVVSLLGDRTIFEPPVVITNFDYRFRVAEQLKEIGAEATILLEPDRRDSAAAVSTAVAFAGRNDPGTIVAVLAADQVFKDERKFVELCARAGAAAEAGEIVTFGVPPDHLATGYGYILPGETLPMDPDVRRVERFVEKPNEERRKPSSPTAISGTPAISSSGPTSCWRSFSASSRTSRRRLARRSRSQKRIWNSLCSTGIRSAKRRRLRLIAR